MKLTQTITFASIKLYCLITLICLIILISHIAQLVLIRKFFTVSVQVRIFPLNMRDIIIYVAWWLEKYFSKRSLIKHTCSWRDKLIVSWTLNRQVKMFLHIFSLCLLKESLKEKNAWFIHISRCLLWYTSCITSVHQNSPPRKMAESISPPWTNISFNPTPLFPSLLKSGLTDSSINLPQNVKGSLT